MIKPTVYLALFILLSPATGNWLPEQFTDPLDGKLDTSSWLLERKGFLPVPIVITEPAVGYGGGLALAYFHDNLGNTEGIKPSVSVIAGAATENGTWFAGGGHLGIWKQDRIRYRGFAGAGLVKMDYYGISGDLGDRLKSRLSFETEALFLLQEVQFRLHDSNLFAGANYLFVDTRNSFNLKLNDKPVPGLPDIQFDSRNAALGLILEYDDRDNILSPTQGTHAQLKAQIYREELGGDNDYEGYHAKAIHYRKFGRQWGLGLRAEADAIEGDAPFYAYPFIDMRGIKAMRYQGEQTLLGEAEISWTFAPRWTLVGFAGVGKSFSDSPREDSDPVVSRGLGIRYLIASKLGLQMGIDIAKGPEDTAFYITAGSAWNR